MSAFITGFGLTKISRDFYSTIEDMVYNAVKKMLDQFGNLSFVDTVIVANAFGYSMQRQNMFSSLISEELGIKGARTFNVEAGQISGHSGLILADSLIKSGYSKHVLLIGFEKMSDYNSEVYNSLISQLTNIEYEGIYGSTLASNFGIIARYYQEKYGLKEEEFASWPILMHENASETYHAQLRFKISTKQVLESEAVSLPIRMLHSPPISDGAAALLISGEDRELVGKEKRVVEIRKGCISSGTFELSLRESLLFFDSLEYARQCYGINAFAEDIAKTEYISMSDDYTITAAVIAETIGLSKKGQFFADIYSGKFRIGDKQMINITGGTKARGYPIGALGVYEAAEISAMMSGEKIRSNQIDLNDAIMIGIGGAGSSSAILHLTKA
ncbi:MULTISPECIES: thiolase family protein [Fervidicoccus]|uniref:Thiolase family protein n=1 Tax=Fervidicoccus fontis TaxID=683846 RepID=A0A7C2ZEC6_9CREN|nr:thiolase family protein [Fervidicoccus fontis]HEW64490.1 thiolase family protein [Fervidicoccus fontis]